MKQTKILILLALVFAISLASGCGKNEKEADYTDSSMTEDVFDSDSFYDDGIIDEINGSDIENNDNAINDSFEEDNYADEENEEDLKQKVMNAIDGNWKNTISSADITDYVFIWDGYIVDNPKYRWSVYCYNFEYTDFYYDDNNNLCFETKEIYQGYDEELSKKNPIRKYILKADAFGTYNNIEQYTHNGTDYVLTASLVRKEYNSYKELLDNKLEDYALLSSRSMYAGEILAQKESIKPEKIVGYALLELDGYPGEELILQEDAGIVYKYYIFTISNGKVKYRGSMDSFRSDTKTQGILYHDEEKQCLCSYVDAGTTADSFYNNAKLLSCRLSFLEGLGDNLRGSAIEFHDPAELD